MLAVEGQSQPVLQNVYLYSEMFKREPAKSWPRRVKEASRPVSLISF